MEKAIRLRNKVNGFIYQKLLKRIFFMFDAELMHKTFIKFGKLLGSNVLTRGFVKLHYNYQNQMLSQKLLGINFENPVGLSAGFDKNGEIISVISDVGFGFSEIGSVTALRCKGNLGKRLARIPEKKSLWVHLGLNNNGCDEIVERLKERKYKIPFGVSIAKTNCEETADDKIGIEDYIYSLKKFSEMDIGDYYVLNISCPNAYGGQPFSRVKAYEALLKESDKLKIRKHIFVKISPDLTKKNIDDIIKISEKHKVSGFIVSNLTKKHDMGKGGLSGKVVDEKSDEMLSYIYKKTKGKYILIGVGGIFSAEDAYRKIKLGANLVELITGMIYQGPGLISEINQGLVELLKKERYRNIREAVGKGVK
ncbi:MAG: quinone-dependent dihydroorotate dehydrogenase [Nanoarchaeota archaeon]